MSKPMSPAMKAFLSKLRKTPRDWRLAKVGDSRWIRRGPLESQCPLVSVAPSALPARLCDWIIAGRRLKLTRAEVDLVADAADNAKDDGTGEITTMRKRLLKACGLPS